MQVFPQSLNPALHMLVEHELPTQAKFPEQLASSQHPPKAMHLPAHGLVSLAHMYSHLWLEPSHLPTLPACMPQSPSLQQAPVAMHAPLHSTVPGAQADWHLSAVRSHVTVRPGAGGQSASMQHSPHLS
jgi:hypothetical protein